MRNKLVLDVGRGFVDFRVYRRLKDGKNVRTKQSIVVLQKDITRIIESLQRIHQQVSSTAAREVSELKG